MAWVGLAYFTQVASGGFLPSPLLGSVKSTICYSCKINIYLIIKAACVSTHSQYYSNMDVVFISVLAQ